jgi:phage terminase large subunit
MTTTKVDIKLNPKQRKLWDIIFDPNRIIEVPGYGGAKGGGKSWLGRTLIVTCCLKYKRSTGLIVRKSFPELEKNHIRKIQREWPSLAYNYSDKYHQFKFPNESILDLTYIENEKDLDNLQGAEYDFVLLDEAEHHEHIVYTTLRSCIRTTNKEIKPFFIITWNWGNIGHSWLKKKFWRRWMRHEYLEEPRIESHYDDTWETPSHWEKGEKPEHFTFIPAKYTDNTFLDEGYGDRLEALPEKLRDAYKKGDPDAVEGQYFSNFGVHLKEKSFWLEPSECIDRLYGSFDYGFGLEGISSFGFWYVDTLGIAHRCFTWIGKGLTASEQAEELVDYIGSFPETRGMFPGEIYYDYAMDNRAGLRQDDWTPTDYFRKAFGKKSKWIRANKNRVNGWQIMLDYFSCDKDTGLSKFRYWDIYNTTFEETIPSLIADKNNPSDVLKCKIDHTADECRYGLVGIRTCMNTMISQNKEPRVLEVSPQYSTETDDKWMSI